MTHVDYASSPDFRAAVSRAQWAVIQTGLITSGLALFGVYVLATRINDLHLMGMYLWDWLPFGPLLVGLIAGSGYILASWWFGTRVGPGMVLAILLVQFAMFLACHYADFETRDLVYRDTGQPVKFVTFFDRTTRRLGQEHLHPDAANPLRGYGIRFAEAMCFALGGMLSALTLVGRPKCGLCGGLVRSRRLARIGGPRIGDVFKRLEERARLSDARGFAAELANQSNFQANVTELIISRCEVCSVGMIERTTQPQATPMAAATATGTATAATATAGAILPYAGRALSSSSPERDSTWRIDVHGEFARQLFELNPAPQPQPRPSDSAVA